MPNISRSGARLRRLPLSLWIASALMSPVYAQVACPTPIQVNGTACVVASGTTVTVSTAAAAGLSAAGSGGVITADGVSVRLGAASSVGAFAQTGGLIQFNGSSLATTSIGAAASGQIGLRAVGAGSSIFATGSAITMSPVSGASVNMHGVSAESGATVTLGNTTVTVARPNGNSNHAVQAIGSGSVGFRLSMGWHQIGTVSL